MNCIRKITGILILLSSLSAGSILYGQQEERSFNCFTVIAGKDASADGSVYLAHNEDDWGDQIVNMYKVPRMEHAEGETITLKNGGKVEQAPVTYEYWWIEMVALSFSDTYLNEHGVMIVSDQCTSREENGDLTDGGIGYRLRRIMAERARTAKEAVKIGGGLVERFGYTDPGRTYCIADENEAWMMAVVMGKHWVAQRVPDDHVAIIPNYYTISEVDLSDTVNFLGSPDIVEYAVSSEFYHPETDGAFSFRKAYSNQKTLYHPGNTSRHWSAMNMLSGRKWEMDEKFPFSFRPREKVEPEDLFMVLRDHYEGTDLEVTEGTPHREDSRAICTFHTQYAAVGQLRSDLPADIGNVMWIAFHRPCMNPFIPFYYGTDYAPEGFSKLDPSEAVEMHFDVPENIHMYMPDHAFALFTEYSTEMDANYDHVKYKMSDRRDEFESGLLSDRKSFEDRMLKTYQDNPQQAVEQITEKVHGWIENWTEIIKDPE